MDVDVSSSRRVINQLHWALADNMNKTVLAMVNTLEAERTRRVDPLLERWLARPLDRWGRFVPPPAGLDPPCVTQLRTRHPAVGRII
eukprot:6674785-Alexandrium_andersonii.AAC.1